MKRIYRPVQLAANIAILILLPLVAAIAIREFFYDSPAKEEIASTGKDVQARTLANPVSDIVGRPVQLEGINWKENRKTVVLYLSTTCRYCKESVPFYRRLLKERTNGSAKVVALFTQPENEARSYLDLHGIKADDVISSSLRPLGVTATPTVLLVNENGIVSNYWRGKLNEEKEAEVIASLAG